MSKDNTSYTHATSLENLEKILAAGKLKTLQHIAKENPDAPIAVESHKGLRIRSILAAKDALHKLKERGKHVDKIFLTQNGINKNYGDFIIRKKLKSPKFHTTFNFIPNEYTISRPLSVKSHAEVYVPEDKFLELKNKYPHIRFKPKFELKEKEPSILDRIKTLGKKVLKKTSSRVFKQITQSQT